MSPATFRQLEIAEQKSVIIAAISRRLEHSRNLRIEVEIRPWFHKNQDRPGWIVPDDPTRLVNPARFRACFLNGSYFFERSTFSRFDDLELRNPLDNVCNSWNQEQGVNRSRVRQSQAPNRTDYRIGTEQDEIVIAGNRYGYWLDGERSKFGEHFLRYLYDKQQEISVDPGKDGETVAITVPWASAWNRKYDGVTRLVLDPAKGFLPIATHGHWERPFDSWRIQENYVIESRLVGDVWMPTKLQEVTRAQLLPPNNATVHNITVLSIEQGTVTPEDLALNFPKGAKVVDTIKGVVYRVGQNGEETNVEPLYYAKDIPGGRGCEL